MSYQVQLYHCEACELICFGGQLPYSHCPYCGAQRLRKLSKSTVDGLTDAYRQIKEIGAIEKMS